MDGPAGQCYGPCVAATEEANPPRLSTKMFDCKTKRICVRPMAAGLAWILPACPGAGRRRLIRHIASPRALPPANALVLAKQGECQSWPWTWEDGKKRKAQGWPGPFARHDPAGPRQTCGQLKATRASQAEPRTAETWPQYSPCSWWGSCWPNPPGT